MFLNIESLEEIFHYETNTSLLIKLINNYLNVWKYKQEK